MPDRYGWCSTERDGPPKQSGWYLVTNRLDATEPGGISWNMSFWSHRGVWDTHNDPEYYFLCPGKEAHGSSPKPQPCPVCGNEAKPCTNGPPYYVMCTKNRIRRVCQIGPDADSEAGAITIWNMLRYEQEKCTAICACNWLVCQDVGGIWIHQNGEKCGLDKCVAANPAEKIVSLMGHIYAKGNQEL